MRDTHVLRLGGIAGILFLILFVPSYLTAPDSPVAASSPEQLIAYFNSRQGEILTFNGIFLVVAAVFFLWFLGVLHDVMRSAEGGGYGFSSVALAGGLVFIVLVLAGAAAEIVHAATQARLQNFREDAQLGFMSLTLSGWMYRFSFAGMAALIAATSVAALRTGFLPKWLAWAGLVAAIVALLRYFGPLGGWLALLWVAVVSVSMIAGAVGRPLPGRSA